MPLLAKAETASKTSAPGSEEPPTSTTSSAKDVAATAATERTAIAIASPTTRMGTERPCSSIVPRENIARTVAKRTESVVVLMPPPVEPGAAPTNMRTIVKSSVAPP